MARTGGSGGSKVRKSGARNVAKSRISANKKTESLRRAKAPVQADQPNVNAFVPLRGEEVAPGDLSTSDVAHSLERLQRLSALQPDPNLEAPADEILTNYALSLLLQLSKATRVPRLAVEGDEWKPGANACHRNAQEWVQMNQEWTVVHGWLVDDRRSSQNYVDLLPHSIVQSPRGELVDITPLPPEAPAALPIFPFLRHIGEAEVFLNYLKNYQVAHLRIRGRRMANVSFFRE